MKRIVYLSLLLLMYSCQYIGQQAPSKEELLKQQIQSINWNEVDEYPSVAECDNLEDKQMRRRCFFEYLTGLIQQKLNEDTLSIIYPELDTIEVRVTIFADSRLEFEPEFPDDGVSYDTKVMDSILRHRLTGFPKVNPAIKRGIPVRTQFVLPVVINVQ